MTESGPGRPDRVPQEGPTYERVRRLDPVFVAVAASFGFSVVREAGAYVSYQGDEVIRIAPYEDLDEDDTLAQMIVHELCHLFVEGEASRSEWDWGLANDCPDDEQSELAAIRAQAALLDGFGLRVLLAPTTDFRFDYDRLPDDPLAETSIAARRAAVGLRRLREHPSYQDLERTLRQVQELSRS